MAFFFLVVGLEARREFDVGELRIRSRLTLPLLVGLAGMAVPIAIYLLFNAGQPSQHGWGMAMSTDTAFALGALALVGRRLPDRVRTYLLTFSVVDDLAGAGGHRDRLQRAHRGGAAALRARVHRRGPDPAGARLPERASLSARRYCLLGSVPQVGRGPDRGRPDLRAADLRVLGQPGVPGAGIRGVPDVPRAAHRRAGPVGAQRGAHRDLAERPAGPAVPPVDQLRHRAAVRAGQRGDRAERRVPGQRLHLAGHARHPGRLPGGQAARHGRVRVAGHQAQPRPAAALRRLGRGGRRRDGRRDRLHRVPADRVAGAEGRPRWPRRSSASCPRRWPRRR